MSHFSAHAGEDGGKSSAKWGIGEKKMWVGDNKQLKCQRLL